MEAKGGDIRILSDYPLLNDELINRLLQAEIQNNTMKIIVLDDDPTGVQTVHDVSVYTDWTRKSVREGFAEPGKLFYILTNSRALTADKTEKMHREIAQTILDVSDETGIEFMLISRSDSTLRGHYPLETDVLKTVLEREGKTEFCGEVLCPFFKEGGRLTIGDIHYVRYGKQLVPAGETEFARDKAFGYSSSDLCAYIEEKTKGRYKKEDVFSISLESIRQMDIDGIAEQLTAGPHDKKIIVNAIDDGDIKVFCIALYRALAQGNRYIFRTAASFVKAMGGITDKPLLGRKEMITQESQNGGMVVIGSYTQKTTEQLNALRDVNGIELIEFDSDLVLENEKFKREIQRAAQRSEICVKAGKTAVVYTKRIVLAAEGDTDESVLLRGERISDALQSLVGGLQVRPDFIIAKGGITSSDIGTKALGVCRATVIGQVKPGIPVWKTGEESKFPQIPYIIFPGNVGEAETLKEIIESLLHK